MAARLWRALGMRIVSGKKGKHYDAAIRNLGRARRCYEKAGLAADWQQVVSEVRSKHHRKSGFMPGFEHVVRGSGGGGGTVVPGAGEGALESADRASLMKRCHVLRLGAGVVAGFDSYSFDWGHCTSATW